MIILNKGHLVSLFQDLKLIFLFPYLIAFI